MARELHILKENYFFENARKNFSKVSGPVIVWEKPSAALKKFKLKILF